MELKAILFADERLQIIDQTLLPNAFNVIELKHLSQAVQAIRKLRVRGAPAIGITAAYALYREAVRLNNHGSLTYSLFLSAARKLKAARPTAVNLEWAVDKMLRTYQDKASVPPEIRLAALKDCAVMIHSEDQEICALIGQHGADIIHDGDTVLTHCNAGILATGGNGTALSVIYEARRQNKNIHVFVDETRPLGQGARLTYWELQTNNVPATLICDNVAGSLMKDGNVNMVIVGADRIALNGDFANKIGTYPLAVLARHHGIPFYCAAPYSTFDENLEDGSAIPIEIRENKEVTMLWKIKNSEQYNVYNPAFDVTPGSLLSGIITERGIIKKPFKRNIKKRIINSRSVS